jgi:hypothetical protein
MTIKTEPDAPKTETASREIQAALQTNSGSHHETGPITVGEPDDAATLAIDQQHMDEFLKVDVNAGVVECKRPPKATFFTVLPEPEPGKWRNRAFYFMLEPEGRDPCLVEGKIAEVKKADEDTIRPVLLVRYVTMAGEGGLWPLKLNPPDGKSNRWNTSAINALNTADGSAANNINASSYDAIKGPRWIRLISKGEYRIQVSTKTMKDTPPRFTERTFAELVNAAFPSDRVIRSLDHPIWDELANGRTK